MVTLRIDAHKRYHTVVAVDDFGRQLAVTTINSDTKDPLGLLKWAEKFEPQDLQWAVEDCLHLCRAMLETCGSIGEDVPSR